MINHIASCSASQLINTQERCIISGFAVDKPISDRRRQQVYRLWSLNIPELHIHISRENSHGWFQWANFLREGTSFFVDAIVQAIWSPLTGKVESDVVGCQMEPRFIGKIFPSWRCIK